jgi:hypothetical protein
MQRCAGKPRHVRERRPQMLSPSAASVCLLSPSTSYNDICSVAAGGRSARQGLEANMRADNPVQAGVDGLGHGCIAMGWSRGELPGL